MVKVRTLVPLQHPTTGEAFAAGTEVDVADDVAADWRADGKVSLLDDEKAQAKQTGNYSARTGRSDTPEGAAAAAAEEKPEKKSK